MCVGNKFKPDFPGEILNCGRNAQYSIDWSLIPTFLTVSESSLWCWGKPFMLLSAIPKTAEENQTPKRISSYINGPILQAATALAAQDMVFPSNIWISDLLVSVCNEEKAKFCVHLCVPLSSMILAWKCQVPSHYRNSRIWCMQSLLPRYQNSVPLPFPYLLFLSFLTSQKIVSLKCKPCLWWDRLSSYRPSSWWKWVEIWWYFSIMS